MKTTSLKAEDLYRRIAESLLDWSFWLDPRGRLEFVSPSCERLTGYAPEEFLADPELVKRIVHADDRSRFDLHFERCEALREGSEIEFRIVARDGSESWVNHRCAVIFDPQGAYLGRWVTNAGIDRYKLAEEKLLRLNQELRAARDCARAVLRATDKQQLFEDVCHTLCSIAGFRMAWIGTVEHDLAKTIKPVAWSGVEDGYLASAEITWADSERGQGPTGTAARTGKSQFIDDYASDPSGRPWRERASQRGYRSSAAIPIPGPDGVWAVLSVYGAEPHIFSSATVRLLEEVADDIATKVGALEASGEERSKR